jgi:pheromone alpha factor receptor
MTPNPPFDPYIQPITLLLPDGTTQANITLDQFAFFQHLTTTLSISRGVEFGTSTMLLLVLLLLTAPSKRRAPVFILNVAALAANALRALLKCVYLDSPMVNVYAQLTGDTRHIRPIDYSNSIAEAIMAWVTLFFILASLLIQVHTVLLTTFSRAARRAVLAVVAGLALASLALQMQQTVVNAQYILAFAEGSGLAPIILRASIMNMVTLSVCMVIFIGKLGYAMVQRRRVGVRRFGAMEVLVIMGCQTMIVPSKFL